MNSDILATKKPKLNSQESMFLGRFVEQKLELSSKFIIVTDMILVTLCCAT